MGPRLPRLPSPGDLIDRYRVVAEIAQGGMAAVYAIRRENVPGFDKLLAMKVLLPQLASERRFVDMFMDEARIAARVQHPNVVQIFDVVDHDGLPVIVMEYLRGHSLAEVLRRKPPVPRDLLLAALARAVQGLHAAHEATGPDGKSLGLVHRDVSPQNIHIGYDGQVKLVDFGIAAARGRVTTTRTGELKGKLSYLAPEQISQTYPVDARADLWAMGVVAWEALTRKRLFRGENEGSTLLAIVNREVPRLHDVVPDLPAPLADILMMCLNRNPEDRPASAASVAHALSAASGSDAARTSELATHMQSVFAADKAREEERISAAVREGSPGPLKAIESTTGKAIVESEATDAVTTTDTPVQRRAQRRIAKWIAVAVFAGIGAIAWGFLRHAPAVSGSAAPAPSSATPPAVIAAPETSAPAAPAAAAPSAAASVTVRIDKRVRLVLVDGSRRDERPLTIKLDEGGLAAVDLVGPSGAVVRRIVTAADDGKTLGSDSSPGSPPPARTPRAGDKSLLRNPY